MHFRIFAIDRYDIVGCQTGDEIQFRPWRSRYGKMGRAVQFE
jgi:hypothetical protein